MCSCELNRIVFKHNLGHRIGLANRWSLQMPVFGPGSNLHCPHFSHRDIETQRRRGSYGRAQSRFIADWGLIIRSPGPTVWVFNRASRLHRACKCTKQERQEQGLQWLNDHVTVWKALYAPTKPSQERFPVRGFGSLAPRVTSYSMFINEVKMNLLFVFVGALANWFIISLKWGTLEKISQMHSEVFKKTNHHTSHFGHVFLCSRN